MTQPTIPLPYGASLDQTRLPSKPLRAVGIDLGTTNCTVAEIVYDPARSGPVKAVCRPVRQTGIGARGEVMVPSLVALHSGKVHIGQGARDLPFIAPAFAPRLYRNFFRDTKNYMGLRRVFHQAPQGFQTARDIAAHLLRFLREDICSSGRPDNVVISIPASFQLAQRRDTVSAAEQAGFGRTRLVDEPMAAFLDFAAHNGRQCLGQPGQTRTLLVFDFGGGTCDTALYRVTVSEADSPLRVAPLAVSRYHRLGGADLDLAIVHEVLLPEMCRQSDVHPLDISYRDKRNVLVPVLLNAAERLRIRLSEDQSSLLEESIECALSDGRTVRLDNPGLSLAQFEKTLAPFVDRDVLWPLENEHRTTCSLFGPLDDVLRRAGLTANNVDDILLAGGCCRMLQIRKAVSGHFPKARLFAPRDAASLHHCVARGAAWEAFFQGMFGRSVIAPAAGDSVRLNTSSGPLELVPRGTVLPYPGKGRELIELNCLAVPDQGASTEMELRLDIEDSDARLLNRRTWTLDSAPCRGEPLILSYRMDGNQDLHMQLRLARDPEQAFACTIENPLVHVVNPDAKRERIQELEELQHGGTLRGDKLRNAMTELADLYVDLGHKEQALGLYREIIARFGPNTYLLNRIGLIYRNMREYQRAEKHFRLAREQSPDSAPLFNLALTLSDQDRTDEALKTVREALNEKPHASAPYHVLCAQLAAKAGDREAEQEHLEQATRSIPPVERMDDWQMDWCESLATMRGDQRLLDMLRRERQKRKDRQTRQAPGQLPDWIVKDMSEGRDQGKEMMLLPA